MGVEQPDPEDPVHLPDGRRGCNCGDGCLVGSILLIGFIFVGWLAWETVQYWIIIVFAMLMVLIYGAPGG